MSKYGEPWIVSRYLDRDGEIGILDQDGNICVVVWKRHHEEVLSRIVVCVNACVDLSDPAAEITRLRAIELAAKEMIKSVEEAGGNAPPFLRDQLSAMGSLIK